MAGRSHRSQRAIANLEAALHEEFPDPPAVEIVDVLEDVARAEADRILATPTLIRDEGGVASRLIGDLGDEDILKQWVRHGATRAFSAVQERSETDHG